MNPFSTMSPRRKRLVFAATFAFGASLVLPGVGPLTRYELSSAAKNMVAAQSMDANDAPAIWAHGESARIAHLPLDEKTAAKMPSDFAVQLALYKRDTPLNKPTSRLDLADDAPAPSGAVGQHEKIAHKLLTLAPQFSQNPSLHAAVLRNLAADAVGLKNRHDGDFLLPDAERAKRKNVAFPTPDNLAAWHNAAQTGEMLEPQNAFFPLMEAVGLYAENRDEEAQTALFRASTQTGYDDHAADEVVGAMRLNEAEETQTAISLLMPRIEQTLPYYAAIDNLARLTAAEAIRAELQNRVGNGFRLRQALRRVGSNIRENSRIWNGTHHGFNIVQTAALRPGGMEEPKLARWADPTTKNYEAYLRKTGHAEEVRAVAFESEENAANKELFRTVQNNPAYFMNFPRFLRAAFLPIASLVLLANALVLLLAGGFAACFARTRQIAGGAPVPIAVLHGAAFVVILPFGVGLGVFLSPAAVMLFAVLIGAACVWDYRTLSRKKRNVTARDLQTDKASRSIHLGVAGLLGTTATLAAFALLALVLGRAAEGPFVKFGFHDRNMECVMGFLSILLTPFLLLFFAACAPKAGVPASVGMVRGMRGICVPLACVLVLMAVPLAVWSAYETGTMRRDLKRVAVHEGRYMAKMEGKPWPLHSRPEEKTTESPRP